MEAPVGNPVEIDRELVINSVNIVILPPHTNDIFFHSDKPTTKSPFLSINTEKNKPFDADLRR